MKVLFLGTGASEGIPGLFCECDLCSRARALGGKNIRTRTSIHIDEKYKIDLPPDTFLHVLRYNLNLADVEYLFITHSHSDHLCPSMLNYRRRPFILQEIKPLHIYGNQRVLSHIRDVLKFHGMDVMSHPNFILHRVRPFQLIKSGRASVMPLPSDHSRLEVSLLYLFEVGGKTILHGYDSGWFLKETWKTLEDYTLDLVILDCTNGRVSPDEMRGHMGIEGVLKTKEHMISRGIANKDTIFVATHFAHGIGGLLHEQLESRLLPMNVQVAFDGLTIEL